VQAWIFGDTETAAAALDRYIDWTPAAAAALQESVLGGDVSTFCVSTENVSCTIVMGMMDTL
jgi:acyl transferase domain-containing protein